MKWHELDAQARRKALILAAIVGFALAALMWPSGTSHAIPAPRPSPFRTAPRRGGNPGRGAPAAAQIRVSLAV
jgi:hypothetical protein